MNYLVNTAHRAEKPAHRGSPYQMVFHLMNTLIVLGQRAARPAQLTERDPMNPLAKIAGTAASLGGVALANKVLAATWTRITGNEPPANNPDEEERWRDIILWSLITGLVATVIKVSITRAQYKMEAKSLAKNGGAEEI